MSYHRFIDDVIVAFYHNLSAIEIAKADESALASFAVLSLSDKEFTANQAQFAVKILQKYQSAMQQQGIDYADDLQNPRWKKPFRVMDYTKRIFIEIQSDGKIWICMKFPYQLKKEFDEEIGHALDYNSCYWDPDQKIRKINLYDANLIHLNEFCHLHNFAIDESFVSLLGQVEEIWQHHEDISAYSVIENNQVLLKNSTAHAGHYFNQRQTLHVNDDLLLAKRMGFYLKKTPETLIEKIAQVEENYFYMSSLENFFDLAFSIQGKTCLVLDRTDDIAAWTKEFISVVHEKKIDSSKIKFCYRAKQADDGEINHLIKENNFGGPIEHGKFFIFVHKPAKWLFKIVDDITIVACTTLYPTTNSITKLFFQTHTCVIHVGKFKPSQSRNTKIVQL